MYEYDLADILRWFRDSHNKATVAIVYADGSGGIWFDKYRFPFGGETLDPSDCLFEFDNLDDMVNRFDALLEEG